MKKETMFEFLKSLASSAKRVNAGTMLVSFKKAKQFDDGDVYILFCKNGIDKFDAVECLVKSLSEDDE